MYSKPFIHWLPFNSQQFTCLASILIGYWEDAWKDIK